MKASMKKGTPPTKARKTPEAAPRAGTNHPDEMKYRAEDALRTLTRAHEIKNDPALMEHVKKFAANQRDMLGKVIRRKT